MSYEDIDIVLDNIDDMLLDLTDLSQINGISIDNLCIGEVDTKEKSLEAQNSIQLKEDQHESITFDITSISNIEGLDNINFLENISEDSIAANESETSQINFETVQIGTKCSKDYEGFDDIHFDEVDREVKINILKLQKFNDENEVIDGSDIIIPIINQGMEYIVNYIYSEVSSDEIVIKENEFFVLPNCKPIKNIKFLTELMSGIGKFKPTTEKIETISLMTSQLKGILDEKKVEREFFNMMLIN